MAESLHAHQIEKVLELGAWRDEGRRFAVGKDGEVFKYHEDDKETYDDFRQRQGAAAPAPSPAPAPPTASGADPESSSTNGRESLIEDYKAHLAEVRLYFDITTIDTDDGLWLIAPMWPIGKSGPRFNVALFLPNNRFVTPTAFGFRSSGQLARQISKKHTNSPEGSICAWSDGDIKWEPGDSPFLLLRLYAEWLLCQLYYRSEGCWPGRQSGLNEVYRWNEFKPNEWCDCGSKKRYGECHQSSDAALVAYLRLQGKSVAPLIRETPKSVLKFARSGWRKPPPINDLPIRPFTPT
jgi:hypothetical protein